MTKTWSVEPRVHDLGPGPNGGASLALIPFPVDEAASLGQQFAAIDPWAGYGYPAASLAVYLSDLEPGAPRYAVMCGDTLAGAVGLRLAWLKGPYLQFLGVLPGYQRSGIGSRIMGWLDDMAQHGPGTNIWVCATETNRSALKFYERHGYSRVVALDGLVQEGANEILLRKRLTHLAPHQS